ncbi:MAG: FAD/NAD(P)-binding protein [Burkholderiales bacterium]
MPHERRTIAIIGAGFCGTMMAVRLLKAEAAGMYDVVLINRPQPAGPGVDSQLSAYSTSLARGLAYGTNSADHLLNVPAGRMSAFDELPHDFEAYLQRRAVAANGGSFVARKLYGDYLRSTLDEVTARALSKPDAPRFFMKHATVTTIDRHADGRLQLAFNEGGGQGRLLADRVVLALGNFSPADIGVPESSFYDSQRYLRDPWQTGALSGIDPSRPVVLIGTGLTMLDVAATLKRRAAAGVPLSLIAISRRGLLAQPHRLHAESPTLLAPPPDMFDVCSARHYLRSVRRAIHQHELGGGNWRDIVASLRPITPSLWASLPEIERRRFLRHVRPYWDSHRHRAAPESAALLADLIASGELKVLAANLVRISEVAGSARVTIRLRSRAATIDIHAAHVVNCTGPSSDIQAEPLLASMQCQGMISPDALRLGLNVADDFRVTNAQGQPTIGVYYVGPLLKARHWEATAVPELRKHVRAAADEVIRSLAFPAQ